MNKPPPMIDNARVLWWAWAGDEPFGLCGDVEIYGFAVIRYDKHPETVYRLSCDRNWESINDFDHQTEEEAKMAIPDNYKAALSRIHWTKYEE